MESTATESMEDDPDSGEYYCHRCEVTITAHASSNTTCPLCHDGFIEKLPNIFLTSAASLSDQNNDHRSGETNSLPSLEELTTTREYDRLNTNSSASAISSSRHDASTESSPWNERRSDRRTNDRRHTRNQSNNNHVRELDHVGIFNEMFHTARPNTVNIDNNGPIFFMSNPADYAWDREGLDTIVSQLINQMEFRGPPPLTKDKIKELPFIAISENQVSESIQCSICWDAFTLSENVRQLPCEHIYHDLCITPWLELHGTCPICRKLLSEESSDSRLEFTPNGDVEALLSEVHRLTILTNGFGSNGNRNRRDRRYYRENVRCYNCHRYGHYARDCYYASRYGGSRTAATAFPVSSNDDDRNRLTTDAINITNDFIVLTSDVDDDDDTYEDDDSDYVYEFDIWDDVNELMSNSSHTTCDACALPLGGHLPHCPRKENFDFDGWENPHGGHDRCTARRGRTAAGSSSSSGNARLSKRCYNCLRYGHVSRDCWAAPSSSSRRPPSSSLRRQPCVHCSKTNHRSDECWFASYRRRSPNIATYPKQQRRHSAREQSTPSSSFSDPRPASSNSYRNNNGTRRPYGRGRFVSGGGGRFDDETSSNDWRDVYWRSTTGNRRPRQPCDRKNYRGNETWD